MSSCAALAVYSSYTAPPEIYSLSLHDALPILTNASAVFPPPPPPPWPFPFPGPGLGLGEGDGLGLGLGPTPRSEEHTSELQSHSDLVCRLLLEKKKKKHRESPTPFRRPGTRGQ